MLCTVYVAGPLTGGKGVKNKFREEYQAFLLAYVLDPAPPPPFYSDNISEHVPDIQKTERLRERDRGAVVVL
jgi:hypothetical protein